MHNENEGDEQADDATTYVDGSLIMKHDCGWVQFVLEGCNY